MKIDLSKEVSKDSWIGWVVCAFKEDYDILYPDRQAVTDADIKLTVNGVEVDFVHIMKRLEQEMERRRQNFDKEVKTAAAELLDEKTEEFIKVLDNSKRDLKERLDLPIDRDW